VAGSPFKAAAVQLRCTEDIGGNVAKAARAVRRGAEAGARLVVLPEVFPYAGLREDLQRESADTIPGHLCNQLSDLARRLGIVLVAGSIREKVPPKRKHYNTCVVFDEMGKSLAEYRKIHLFDIDTKETGRISESKTLLAGDEEVVVATSLGAIGLTICYDLRFPELYRGLAFGGAQIITVPSAFTRSTGAAHWMTLLRARAIENQCFIVAANQCGTVSGTSFYGHSAIIDPWGKVLAEAGGRPEVIVAAADFGVLEDVRRRLPSLATAKRMHHRCL